MTAASTRYTGFTAAGQAAQVWTPDNYSANTATPLAVYFHGANGLVTDREDDPVFSTLRANGWATAACQFHDSNWGNQAAVDDLADLLAWVADRLTVGPVMLVGGSMGGLASLNAVHQGVDVVGWYGIKPACSLAAMYDGGAGLFAGEIEAAHSFADPSGYAAATAGMDPATLTGWPDIRYRFVASPDDLTVVKADNTDVMRTVLDGETTQENSLLTVTGDHSDESHFDAADLLAFAQRCTA